MKIQENENARILALFHAIRERQERDNEHTNYKDAPALHEMADLIRPYIGKPEQEDLADIAAVCLFLGNRYREMMRGAYAAEFFTAAFCAAVASVKGTDEELEDIHRMISEEQGQDKGAFHVEYDDFKKLYDFSMRTVGRSNRDVQTLLFTLSSGGTNTEVAMDDIMEILKQAVITSLRSVDTGTKYSCSQYIVLLMDTDLENGRAVAGRVLEKFNQNEKVKASGVKASFDIQPLKAK